MVLSEPSGHAMERDVPITSELVSDVPSAANLAINISLFVLIPIVCLALGFAVAFIRTHDRNAWLLLFLLIGFSCLAGSPNRHRTFPDLTFYWEGFFGATATLAIWMMLFAIHFPNRLGLDRLSPWLTDVLSCARRWDPGIAFPISRLPFSGGRISTSRCHGAV